MAWLEPIWLAEIHREVYVAILKSCIPHGEKGSFARRVGITQEYLSYLCSLDRPAEGKYSTKRLPSSELGKKMAVALPAANELKQSLIENMELAHTYAAQAHYVTRQFIAEMRVGELLAEIEATHRLATFGTASPEVKRAYRTIRNASAGLIPRLSPDIYPASLVQACLFLHDAQCVLDRADDALRYAKLACLVLDNVDFVEKGFDAEQVENLKINALRGQGVALHNLGLDRRAQDFYDLARGTTAYRTATEFWKPLVERDLLNALVHIPRFSLRDAQKMADDIEAICERKGDDFTLFLIRESWIRCLIEREKWKPAQKLFWEEMERLPVLPYVGSLHRALLLKTGARLAWKMGDKTSWRILVGKAVAIMQQAGLDHQMRSLRQIYGPELGSLSESGEILEPD